MGTNYYILDGTHIGKRSAAGMYCYDCGITLCKTGKDKIHHHESDWFETCPVCGKTPIEENLSESSVGRELGFNNGPFKTKIGVKSCSSFTWAMPPSKLKSKRHIKDEYNWRFTMEEFKEILDECPIQYYSLIGLDFS